MKKIISILLTVVASILLTGCTSKVDIVKNSVMNFNQTITLGDAFDNWSDCKNSEWEEFEVSNGAQVVQFTCEEKGFQTYMSKLKSLLTPEQQKNEKVISGFNVESSKIIYQFTMNKNDTFQLDNVRWERLWKDGKSTSNGLSTEGALEKVYNNKITYDVKKLNNKLIIDFQASGLVKDRMKAR